MAGERWKPEVIIGGKDKRNRSGSVELQPSAPCEEQSVESVEGSVVSSDLQQVLERLGQLSRGSEEEQIKFTPEEQEMMLEFRQELQGASLSSQTGRAALDHAWGSAAEIGSTKVKDWLRSYIFSRTGPGTANQIINDLQLREAVTRAVQPRTQTEQPRQERGGIIQFPTRPNK